MELTIEFNHAAFEDIRFAISMIDEEGSTNKHLIIGFDRNANH